MKSKIKNQKLEIIFSFIICFSLLSTGGISRNLPKQGDESIRFAEPALLTSAGQSAEVQMASVLAKRAQITVTLNKMSRPEDLEIHQTLILSLGASLKGLGAAGLDIEQEMGRVRDLIQAAEEKDAPILMLHLGGEARRGQLSDRLINEFIPYADKVIVVASGNQDSLFTHLCQKNNIPLVEVERVASALEPMQDCFN